MNKITNMKLPKQEKEKCCEKCYGSISGLQWWCNDKNCDCHTPPITTKAEWEERLKPKVTIFTEEYNDIKDIALKILFEYWYKLKPEITELIKQVEQDTEKRVVGEVKEMVEELGHQQDDDTIWCNMDDIITNLTSKYE